jgi:predicted nucleotidyltransferase
MQKITGIIAEFNPFHNGHKRLLDAAADSTKVVVMSGNWMQRGEPAFIDKWTRAEMALSNGADLVVELPLLSAVQGADFFAKGAFEILRQLGANEILFGTEADATDYQRVSEVYAEKKDEMTAFMATLPELMSYPLKAEKTWEKFADVKFDGGSPNHILGLAYAKAAAGTEMQLRTLQRDSGYNSSSLVGSSASATAIRENWQAAQDFVPENCWGLLQAAPKTSWQDFFSLLRYKITAVSPLTDIYQVNDELASRIKVANQRASDLSELIELVYTKRYTKGHIRRLLTYILLDVRRELILPTSIHVLGFDDKGRRLLAQAREAEVPLTTRIGQYAWDTETQRADEIYRLGNPNLSEQTYARKPIIL